MEFKLHIGDWSDDGHGEERIFHCISDAATIECLREVYFEVESKLGINLEEVCGEYGEHRMNPAHSEVLFEHGIITEDHFKQLNSHYDGYVSAKDMAEITIACLNYVNPDYNVRFHKPQKTIPTLHFYGYDSEGRHIGYIGYGVLGND